MSRSSSTLSSATWMRSAGAGGRVALERAGAGAGRADAGPADLDAALLEHVEQRDLDALGEVGQLVDAEDAAVGARHQAVVDGLRVAVRAARGGLLPARGPPSPA